MKMAMTKVGYPLQRARKKNCMTISNLKANVLARGFPCQNVYPVVAVSLGGWLSQAKMSHHTAFVRESMRVKNEFCPGVSIPPEKRIHNPDPVSECMLCPFLDAPPTRNTCPQSHKGDRVDAVFKIDKAPEVSGDVAYDGGVPADKQNADYKSWVASPDSCKSKHINLFLKAKL